LLQIIKIKFRYRTFNEWKSKKRYILFIYSIYIWSSILFKFQSTRFTYFSNKTFLLTSYLTKKPFYQLKLLQRKSLFKHTIFLVLKSRRDIPTRCIQWTAARDWWAWKEMRRWTVKVDIRPSSRSFHLDNPDQTSNEPLNGTIIDPYRISWSILL
jgi:hypothetical protein